MLKIKGGAGRVVSGSTVGLSHFRKGEPFEVSPPHSQSGLLQYLLTPPTQESRLPGGWKHLEDSQVGEVELWACLQPRTPFPGTSMQVSPLHPLPRMGGGVGMEHSEHPHPSDGYLRAETQSVGWDLGSETGDPPERAWPSWGLRADKRLLVLRMPAPSQTYLQQPSGDSYTHRVVQSLPGWSWGGGEALLPLAPEVNNRNHPKLNHLLPHRQPRSPHTPPKSVSYRQSQSPSYPLL